MKRSASADEPAACRQTVTGNHASFLRAAVPSLVVITS